MTSDADNATPEWLHKAADGAAALNRGNPASKRSQASTDPTRAPNRKSAHPAPASLPEKQRAPKVPRSEQPMEDSDEIRHPELQLAEDGHWYTKAVFKRFYGGVAEWKAAKKGGGDGAEPAEGGQSPEPMEQGSRTEDSEPTLAPIDFRAELASGASESGEERMHAAEGHLDVAICPMSIDGRQVIRSEANATIFQFSVVFFGEQPNDIRSLEIYADKSDTVEAIVVYRVYVQR